MNRNKNHAPKNSPIGTYRVDVISIPEECDWEKFLPIEIQYIFKKHPEYIPRIRTILSSGKAIGVRTILKTPEHILDAVHTVSVYSQRNYIITWLPRLLRDKHYPVVTDADRQAAQAAGHDLDTALESIVRDRLRFKQLVLIDEENRGIIDSEKRFMTELSELIYPLQVDYAVFRVSADNANHRTAIAQSIIKALLLIGPIAHVLEHFAAGVGKVFAASADDLLGEAAELSALHGSGFSKKELVRRSIILIPVFVLASWAAYSVHGLIENGQIIWGGVLFGVSAVALSLTTAIQSLFMYRSNLTALIRDGKLHREHGGSSITGLAWIQDFTNPARMGLFLGAACSPLLGIVGALLGLLQNGWVLAIIGSTESIIAGLTVIFASRIGEWRFRRRLQKLIHQ